GHERRKAIELALQPVVLDRHVLAFDVAGFVEAFAERSDIAYGVLGRPAVAEADDRRRLLRLRHERPRGSRAAEQRDALVASHVWMAPAWQAKLERAAQKSLAVMLPACSRSPDGLVALMESATRGLITRAGSMTQ